MKTEEFPRFILTGILAGGMTGAFDVLLTVFYSPNHISTTATVLILTTTLFLLQTLGIVLGAGLSIWVQFAHKTNLIHHLLKWIKRPLLLFLASMLLMGSTATIFHIGYRRGIMLDAIDYRPLALVTVFLAAFPVVLRFFTPVFRKQIRTGALLIVISAVMFSYATPMMRTVDDALTLAGQTTVAKLGIAGIKTFFDKDNDGFSTIFCKNDCDCDDLNKQRNPASLDIPGNGIDEDCNGSDLIVSTITVKTAPKPKAAISINPPYNIVLITVDTLRADRMHLYGHTRQTTPNIDAFAQKSVWFRQVRSQGPSTRHVFPVLLTGRYFSTVALEKGKKWWRLLNSNITFAEHLKKAGYQTRAVLPYFRFKSHSGFHQGFDVWEPTVNGKRDATWDPTGDLVTDRGIEHLNALKKTDSPWLLWLHYFDPHASYVIHDDPPGFGNERPDRYDGEISYVDKQIQRFLDEFECSGVADSTAIIFTSDHGEGIGLTTDHGFNYHGFSLFDSETRIPLIVQIPKVAPQVIENNCMGLIDVPPTILTLAGITPPPDMHGHSLLPYFSNESPKRPPLLMQLPETKAQHAIVEWPYKLIWYVSTNRYSLFNLSKDPNETSDLVNDETERVEQLKKALKLKLYQLKQRP